MEYPFFLCIREREVLNLFNSVGRSLPRRVACEQDFIGAMFTNDFFEHLIVYAGGKESGIEPHVRQSGDVIIHILEAIHSAEVSQDDFQIREAFCNLSRGLREAMYQVGGERVPA